MSKFIIREVEEVTKNIHVEAKDAEEALRLYGYDQRARPTEEKNCKIINYTHDKQTKIKEISEERTF